jgi:hypothetical protein
MVAHAIAFYGTTRYKKKVKITYKKQVWKRRKDGVKQRYRKTIVARRVKNVKGGKRLTVYGTSQEIRQVKQKIEEGWIPRRQYVDRVSAELFLRNVERYARRGRWIDFEEEES